MFEIILKIILSSLFFLIFLHAYLVTKNFAKTSFGYPMFYIGIILVSLIIFFEPIKHALLLSSAVFIVFCKEDSIFCKMEMNLHFFTYNTI
ncbi:MAG: hypothetical protein PWQ48_771 [Thermotogaceae bacterium]|jgi:hypothetical protein|nr:hypothetical protein [Thermotogaceae bacterium]